MTDDRTTLVVIAKRLQQLCSHVSVRDDESVPYLFAVGMKRFHSLELRQTEGALELELWRGPDGADEPVSETSLTTFEEAVTYCEEWLRNETTSDES